MVLNFLHMHKIYSLSSLELYSKLIIRKFTAGLMLLLFALSITPKQLLHDTLTGHKHSYQTENHDANVKSSKPGFNCNWNHDLLESPFTGEPAMRLDHPITAGTALYIDYRVSYHSTLQYYSSLRGPPCLA